RYFLSCCDSNLLGKRFTEGKACLRVTESFYKGEICSLDEAAKIIKNHMGRCDSIQIIGECIINRLDAAGIISKECAKVVKNVPHIMFVRF
ncbi:DUF424 family protein, partial [Candidatus Bathyarchaeota archaeon]|nr:DUF424 family protein [Candidatus Bathyarchaeota archaeon]